MHSSCVSSSYRSSVFVVAALVSACFIASSSTVAGQFVEAGYSASTVPLDANVFYGGFALLPSGNAAVYDGRALQEIDLTTGAPVSVLLAFAGSPFGAFLELSSDQQRLYFGESSSGGIYEIELSSGSVRQVAEFSFPYDMTFDRSGAAYVSWSPGFFQGGRVSRLDVVTGQTDLVLVAGGASGPLVFDDRGDLYYAVADTSWPPPPDSTTILRFPRRKLQSVRGLAWLTESDGIKIADVDGAHSMVFDESGDLFVSDSVYYQIVEIDAETGAEQLLVDGPDFQGLTYLAYSPAPAGDAFERFQPAHSGALIALASDFFTYNELLVLRPERPAIATNPASPIPPGLFDFTLSNGVPNGTAWLWLTVGLLPQELRAPNATWPAPLYVGLDFTGGLLLRQRVALDASGSVTLQGDSSGFSGVSFGVQALVGASNAGPLYGTSQPLEIRFQ